MLHPHVSSDERTEPSPGNSHVTQADSFTKRSFLRYLLFCLTGIATAMMTWGISRFVTVGIAKERKREFPERILHKLQPDVPVHIPEAGVWVMKTKSNEQIIALDDRCTHLGCRQKWNAQSGKYECPCHGSIFDRDGKVLRGPASRPMPRLYLRPASKGIVRLSESPPAS